MRALAAVDREYAPTETALDVRDRDLAYICTQARDAFLQLAGKRLLITGGAGFLGYYLVQTALHWNATEGSSNPIFVTVYDNYVRGVPAWLADLKGNRHLDLVRHDIRGPMPDGAGPFEYVVHAAGIASPIYYRRYPIQTMDANINGLRTLLAHSLDHAEATSLQGFLFFSSSEIYGDPTPENIPTPETYRGNVSCTGPRACYDESKRYGETLCVNFAGQYGLPVKIARPFNNYGPGLKITDGRALPDLCRDVLHHRDVVLHSDGSPTRTFCYSADAVSGYIKALVHGDAGEAYNIGVERPEIAMRDLATMIVDTARDLFGYRGKVVHRPHQDADYLVDNPNRRCPVIDKARSHLGYSPQVSLADGIRRSLIWYRDNLVAAEA
jgi:nucleoside-diphosphate-sugar epimerase